jgi:hypothetical protein
MGGKKRPRPHDKTPNRGDILVSLSILQVLTRSAFLLTTCSFETTKLLNFDPAVNNVFQGNLGHA